MKKQISWNFALGFCLIAIFLAFGPRAAHAGIDNGKIMWSTNGKPRGDKNGSWIVYDNRQGAQGTHWVWRIQKYYPDFTLACSTDHPNGCTANKTEGKFEYTTVQLTVKLELKAPIQSANPGAGIDVSVAKTQGSTYQIGQTIFIKSGYTAYAMIIALDKYVPKADYNGIWMPTGKARLTCNAAKTNCSPREYEMKWENNQLFADWSGHMVTNARSFMCATKTTAEPKVGDGPPSGCVLPKIPY